MVLQDMPKHTVPRASQPVQLFNDFIPRFGIPCRIHHGEGREFENKLFHTLGKYCGTICTRTTPYPSQGNCKTKRFNETLFAMLRARRHHRNLCGRIMLTRWCMPTTVRGMRQQGTDPSSCYLVTTQEFLWT